MTYTIRPDSSGDTLNSSKIPIQTNFTVIRTDFGVDHATFNATSAGKHNKSTYREQATDSEPTTTTDESTVWSRQGASSAKSELYIRQESQSGNLSVGDKDFAIYGVSAAGLFNGNTGAAVGSHNVNFDTIVKNSNGNFTMPFTNDLSTENYMVFITAQLTPASAVICTVVSKIVGEVVINIASSSGSGINTDRFSIMIYGELA